MEFEAVRTCCIFRLWICIKGITAAPACPRALKGSKASSRLRTRVIITSRNNTAVLVYKCLATWLSLRLLSVESPFHYRGLCFAEDSVGHFGIQKTQTLQGEAEAGNRTP